MKSPILPYLVRRFLFGAKEGSVRSATLLTAAAGIFFACALVLVSLGILTGFQRAYKRAVLDFNTHVIVQNYFSEFGLNANDQDLLRELLQGLNAEFPHTASAYLFEETLMPTKKGLSPVGLKGIEWPKRGALYPYQAQTWEVESPNTPPLFVGADILNLQDGIQEAKKIKILKLKGPSDEYQVGFETLAVTGVFKSGLYNFDSRYALMDVADLQRRKSDKTAVDGFEIRLADPDQIPAFEKRLRKIMPNTFRLKTWDEINGDLFEALELERTAFVVIAVLILMIASLNIFGFNFLFFLQREREFLILSLMGLAQTKLRALLALLSLGVGAVATFLAAVVAYFVLSYLSTGPGIALDPKVYFVDRVPVLFEARWFLYFILCTWILCLVTSAVAAKAVLKRHLSSGSLSF